MKRSVSILIMLICAGMMTISAQNGNVGNDSGLRMSSTYIKDQGYGARVNFGVTFAPTIDWMYPHTEGYDKNGVIAGMR